MKAIRFLTVLTGIALLLVATMFPPFVRTETEPGMAVITEPAGHHFLLDTPLPVADHGQTHRGVQIDFGQYLVGLGVLTLVLLIALGLQRGSRSPTGSAALTLGELEAFLESRQRAASENLSHGPTRDIQKAELGELIAIRQALASIREGNHASL